MEELTVHYILESPLDQRDYARFGIDVIKKSFRVRIWDISPFHCPELYSLRMRSGGVFRTPESTLYENEAATLGALSKLGENDVVVCLPRYAPQSLRLLRALGQSRAKLGTIALNALPGAEMSPLPNIYNQPILQMLKKVSTAVRCPTKVIEKVWRNIVERVPPLALGVRAYDFILASGIRSLDGIKIMGERTKVLWSHSFDYELYLKERLSGADIESGEHVVFLDEYVPFHQDYVFQGIAPPVTAEEYYPALVRFFEKIEQLTGKTVVIAAHPRSNYDRHPDYFGDRKVILGQTPRLVSSAALVLSHSSTAISYAVLAKKPVVFITFSKFWNRFEGSLARTMSRLLNKVPITIDAPSLRFELQNELTIDEKAYESYIKNYIKGSETSGESQWLALCEYLNVQNG